MRGVLQAHHALVAPAPGRARPSLPPSQAPEARPQGCLSDSLVHAGHVNMSVVIRAARNLPVTLLASEFEQVLQRRHAKVSQAHACM